MKPISKAPYAAITLIACTLVSCSTANGNLPTATEAEPQPTDVASESAVIAWEPPEHLIGIRHESGAATFYDISSGETFWPRGVNYVFVPNSDGTVTNLLLKVGIYDPFRIRRDFATLADHGYNTVRVFLDHCSSGPGCIGDIDNQGLNPEYLDNLADLILAAKETGVFLILTSNDLPDQGGYAEEANSQIGDRFAGYRNSYYLTEDAVKATRRYWRDLLSSLTERQTPFDAVLAWQLLNEQWMFSDQPPLSLQEGSVVTATGTYDMADDEQKAQMVSDGLIHYIAQVKSEILRWDPSALVTMGFFAPGLVPGWYVDPRPLLEHSALDFFDFHAYPGMLTLQEHVQRLGMMNYSEKPIILGEYGPFRHIYSDQIPAARAVTQWLNESCQYGFDGWLYWSYYPAPPSAGDQTWGFTDQENYFQSLLSPALHPDPCIFIEVSTPNLAYGKQTQASRWLVDEPPEFAVDENEATQWGSGADAPQWIEVGLGASHSIHEIRLLVGQFPPGETVHQILIRLQDNEEFEMIHEFRGTTQEGDWLIFTPETSIQNVGSVRIRTILSPSWVAWKEVQIHGEEQ